MTNIKHYNKCLFFIITFIFPLLNNAQNNESMPNQWGENWLSGNFSLTVNNQWKFSFEDQLRIKYVNKLYDRSFSEFKIENFLLSQFSWGVSYRRIFKSHEFENRTVKYQRFNFQISQKWNLDRIAFKYRIQYQTKREVLANTNKHVNELIKYWRLKTSVSYNIKDWKLDPNIGVEFFVRGVNHPTDQYNKYRISLGTKYKINKNQNIRFKYMFEKQYKGWNPEVIHIASIQYNYRFKHKTKNYKEKKNEE